MLRRPSLIAAISCLTFVVSIGCSGREDPGIGTIRGEIDLQRVLSWLPTDTETILVANGPIWMSSFQTAEDYNNHAVTSEELEKTFEGMTLSLFDSKNGLLEKSLAGKKLLFALEGSRNFRSPAGLGEMPFDGCAVVVFKDDLSDRRDAFMKDAALAGAHIEEIKGQKVAVFQESREQDTWTLIVTFPRQGVVLVASDRLFLIEMLARMRGEGGARALPDTLPEWKYVDTRAQFWGLRHYAKKQVSEDPTAPFGDRRTANLADDEAIGLTFQLDSSEKRTATLTYLSGPKADVRKIEESRFPKSSEPEATMGLHIQYQVLTPGVIQSTYDLNYSQPLNWFFFVLMANMGHAIYL
jgi:hypothetical protein